MSEMTVRPFHMSDLGALYDICLRTGDSGKDARTLHSDRMILGHYFAAPYVAFEPSLCFVIDQNTRPVGYILGTSDSRQYSRWAEEQWFPLLRRRYAVLPENFTEKDRYLAGLIHKGYTPREELRDYPAHLHIDILPEGQGGGMGRRLIDTFVEALKKKGVTALHLEVGRANPRAIAFYRHIGFHLIREYPRSLALGMRFA